MSVANKYLQEMIDQFEATKDSVNKVVKDLSEEQFNQRPGKNRWSIGECIDHLNASYNAYIPIIKNVIANSVNDNTKNPDLFNSRFRFKFFTKWLEPPYKIKAKTFEIFMPKELLNKNETLAKFSSGTDEFIELIKKSEKIDLKNSIIISPVTDKLKFRLGELYPFMAAHIRRHIWQAEQVKNNIL